MTAAAARDEMVDGTGGIRPQWRGILGAFAAMGEGGLQERARRLDLAFEEEGVTSVLPGASAAEHSWRCDPIPLPIGAAEFAGIEAGLAQRAALLEAVLADIYGPQDLLADGTLPPALVYANPGFLRLSQGTARAPLLQNYAADLIRGPDGAWRVLADRTVAPRGIGYARENRRLLTRVTPEVFRTAQARQLRPFFDVWQDALQRLAPGGKPSPAVALLTPGTAHAQWFEHMYLARELSCALVEPGDLTVRGGAVFIKTLKGLQAVDVLLRRTDGRAIDPLELDQPTALGVPGLLDAVRGGQLRVTNDPGSGMAEAPALAAFLPQISMRLLRQRLLMASVPTMWLGEDRARGLVERDPGYWLIRPALDGGVPAVAPSSLSDAARADLMARIAARPWGWAATALIPPSVAPCVSAAGMAPKPVVLRVFLIHDGTRWQAMQGGLARVVDEESERLAGRLPRTGVSKDVWVLSEDRTDIVGPMALAAPPLRIRRTSGDLPSRVADNMFWLGRYVERLDRAARLVRAAVTRLARGGALLPRETLELRMLAACLAHAGFVDAEAAQTAATAPLLAAISASVREPGAIEELFADIARLTEAARDRLTGEMYATFTHALRAARAACGASNSLDGLAHGMISVLRFVAAVSGVAAENMVRGGGWLFLDLGRRLERARAITADVAVALDQPPPRIDVGLRLILELCDSAITYRSRYLNVLQPAPVLDLVLVDQGNPRGLAFQLTAVHTLLDELAGGTGGRERFSAAAAGLLAEAEMLVEGVLAAADQAVAAAALPAEIRQIGAGVAALSDRINRRYFALLPAVQTLGWSSEAAEPAIPATA